MTQSPQSRRPLAPIAILYRIDDVVVLRNSEPPILATVTAVRPSRGPACLRIAYEGPDGAVVRHWVTLAEVCQVTMRELVHGAPDSEG